MKSFKKILSVMMAVLMVCSLFTTVVNAEVVTGKNKIVHTFFKQALVDGKGVGAHFVDVDGDGAVDFNENGVKLEYADIVYCLERGKASTTEISTFWEGETKIKDSNFWKFELNEGQRNAVTWTLLHGYPNTTTSYGLTGISQAEKIFATQILVWEFTDGARAWNNYSYTGTSDVYKKAFNTNDINYSDGYLEMTKENGKFVDAYAYYCKLLDAIKSHTDTPSRSDNTYSVAPSGSGSFYTYSEPGTYTITNSMFSEFTFKSSETNTVSVSQSGDTLTLNIKKACNTVEIEGTKKSSVKNNTLSAPVMIESGSGKQKLMYGTLEDPVYFFLDVQAEASKGGIGVMKEDTYGNPVAGVKFGVYSDAACTKQVSTMTTNDKGWAQYGYGYPNLWDTGGLESGTKLYVKEISAPDNVILDSTVRAITVASGKWYLLGANCTTTVQYNMFDSGIGSSANFRLDSVIDGVYTNGIKYEIYTSEADAKNETNEYKVGTTATVDGSNGKGPSWTLPAGDYYLKVMGVPSGSNIVIPGTLIPFRIVENTFTGITLRFQDGRAGFVNETRGAIAVKKTDVNGNALSGAKFGVYTSQADATADKNRVNTITTDETGIGVYGGYKLSEFSLVPDTTYYVKEVEAPTGYIVDNTIRTVTVQSSYCTFIGSTATGERAKIAYLDKGSYADSTVTVSAQAKDSNGNPIQGVYFDFYNENSVFLKRVATDANGNANYSGTAGKTYYVKLTAGKDTKDIKYDNVKYKLVGYAGTVTRLYLRPDTAITNNNAGALRISKQKKTLSGELLVVEDFRFDVYSDASCTTKVTTIETDVYGNAHYGVDWSDGTTKYLLEEGKTYYFKESATQPSYIKGIVLDTETVYSATVVSGKFVDAVNSNGSRPINAETTKGGIGVMKVTADGRPMSDVTFGLYSDAACTQEITTQKTNTNGVIVFGGYNYDGFEYEAGTTYYVKELDTYAGYVLDETVYPVTVVANSIVYVGENESTVNYSSEAKAVNKEYGHLVLNAQRVSGGTKKNYAGLKVAIYASSADVISDNRIETLTTFSDGSAVYGECKLRTSTLVPGDYYAKVVGAGAYADEFTDNATAIPFTVYRNTTTTITITNSSYIKNYTDNYGAIGVLKIDEDGNTLSGIGVDIVTPGMTLPGIVIPSLTIRGKTTFGVYSDADCTQEITRISTGLANPMATYGEYLDEETGTTKFTLKVGTKYYIKEIYALAGYVTSEKVYPVTVKAGQVTFVGTDKTYIRYETPGTVQNENYGGFIIRPYGSYSEETIASTITIKQFDYDEEGNVKYNDTNGNGQRDEDEDFVYKTNDTYTIKAGEDAYCYGAGKTTLAEATYSTPTINDLYIITIENKDENGELVSRNYSAYVQPNTTTVIAVDNYTGVVNYNYGGIKIQKTNLDGAPIQGCEFEVSTSPTFDTIIDTIVTDEYGDAEIRYTGVDGKYQPYDETTGGPIYYLRESKCPDEYMLNTDIFAGIIGKYEGEFTDEQTLNGEIEIEVPYSDIGWSYIDVVNRKLGSLKIVKNCVWGADDFEFTIKGLDEENKHIEQTGVTVADKTNPNVGYVIFENLVPGMYSITETTKEGYYPVTIDDIYIHEELSDVEQSIEVDNHPVSGTLTIQKEVSEGPVEGWKFRVEGTFVNGETYSQVHTTDANGQIKIEGLYNGTFTITELEEQDIVGYYPEDVASQEITLDWTTTPSKNFKTVKFKNILNEFKIYKVDMYDYPMPGVKFGVYLTPEDAEADTNRVTTLVTDENGWAYFRGFDKKEYFIKEVETYPGYQMSAEIIYIDNTNGQYRNSGEGVADWVCVNYYTPIHTGVDDVGNPVALLAAPIVLGTGAVVYGVVKSRKKKKKKS